MIYASWLKDNEKYNDTESSSAKATKMQHDAAWKLLEYALQKQYGISFYDCTIVENKWGKPSLEEHPDIYFSISHCKGIAVCVLADDEIGIDVEVIGRTCRENVCRRVLSDEEYERLMKINENERDREFLKYWTLKESYGKAIGKGLSYDYKAVIFSIEDNDIECNLPDYKLWQTFIEKGEQEVIISVCRKHNKAEESIEWVNI